MSGKNCARLVERAAKDSRVSVTAARYRATRSGVGGVSDDADTELGRVELLAAATSLAAKIVAFTAVSHARCVAWGCACVARGSSMSNMHARWFCGCI